MSNFSTAPIRDDARALLDTWQSPALERITTCTDPRVNPRTGTVVAVGGRFDIALGPPVSRVFVVRDGEAVDPLDPTDWPRGTRSPRWSPDGDVLAFTSDREQAGIHQVAFAQAHHPAAAVAGPALPGTVEHLAWSPTGERLLAVVAPRGAEQAGAMGSGRIGGPLPQEGPADIRRFDGEAPEFEWRRLWSFAPGDGEPRCLTPNGPCVWEAMWATSDSIVAIVSDRPEEDAWYGARLSMIDAASGVERVLCTSDRQLGLPVGSPDGRWAACVEAPCSDRTLVAGRLVVVDLATGEAVPHDPGFDVTQLVWLADGRLQASGLRGMDTVVEVIDVVDVESPVAIHRWRTDATVGPRQPEASPTPDGGIVVAAESWDEPPHLLQLARDGSVRTIWSGAHAGTRDLRSELPQLERREWLGRDGLRIEGLLVRPAGGGPHPLVLYPHGGPVAQYRRRFAMGYVSVPLLLRRGYAVFMPNPRGSAGYGWAFADAVHGDMGGEDTHDLLAGVDALVAEGIADPGRLAVMGGSYAGYMACWLVTQTTRFAAAVASAPVTDWISHRFQSNIPQWGVRFLPDTDRFPAGGWVDRSPVFFADRVTTPLALDAGAHDRCCPTTQAIEMHEALRQRGVPTALAVFRDDAHNIPVGEAALDWFDWMVGWIERWCPATPPTDDQTRLG